MPLYHVSKNIHIHNCAEKKESCAVWRWKYCSVKVLVQSSRTPAATVSFFFKPTVLTAAGTLELYFLWTSFLKQSEFATSHPQRSKDIEKQVLFFSFVFECWLLSLFFFLSIWSSFRLRCFYIRSTKKHNKMKRSKASKCAAAWCKKEGTSLWLGGKSSLLASLTGFDEAKGKTRNSMCAQHCSITLTKSDTSH